MNNWIPDAAKSADGSKGYIFLEDPKERERLDSLLLQDYWPGLKQMLANSGHSYTPEEEVPDPTSDRGRYLGRTIQYMLYDQVATFHIGSLTVCKDTWMVESTFFLGLPGETDFKYIKEFLGNSRLWNSPPKFTINKASEALPYQIEFTKGFGLGWYGSGKEQVLEALKNQLTGNIAMYDAALDGFETEENARAFLEAAVAMYGE